MNRTWLRVATVLRAFLLLLAGAAGLPAQIFPGRITGTVRDATGGVITGAQLKLTGPAIAFERTVVTDTSGTFNFPELPLSKFNLTVTKDGFKTYVQNGITTATGQVNDIQVEMTLGSVSTQVEVTGAPPLLQTETNTAGGLLNRQQVTELPLSNEDYTRFAFLLPGVTQNTNFAFSNFTVNGGRSRSSSFNVDGAANTDPYIQLPSINQGGNSATAATRVPPDAIDEVQLLSNASADFGQSSGGVMNVVMLSGTNQFHGSAYIRHRDKSLDAHNFFENLGGLPKAPFIWNNYGGSFGGPLWRDRTFFFVAYDGSRLSIGTTLSSAAPTPTDIANATTLLRQAIPSAMPNPLGLAILQQYGTLSGPFVRSNRGRQSPDSGVAKIDHKISPSDSLSGRYLIGNGFDKFPVGGTGPGGGSQLEKFFGLTPTRVHNFALSEVHIFTPRLLNTARLGFNRFHQAFQNADNNFDPSSIGLVTGSKDLGLPEIDISAGAFENLGTTTGFPGQRFDTTVQVADDVSYTLALHSLKFGFNFFHNKIFGFNDNNFRGILSFDGSQVASLLPATTTPALTPALAGLVDLLAGRPDPSNSNINRGGTRFDVTQNIFSLYATDTYRVRSDLNFIFGLRYELIGVPKETRGRFSNFLPALGLVNVSQLPDHRIYDLVKANIGPRFAVAYTPFHWHGHATVIRAGYGIFHDITPLDLLVGEGLNPGNANPGLATNPIGTTGVFNVSVISTPIAPNVPVFPTGTPRPPFNLIAIDRHLKPQNAQNWNFNVQQELAPNVVFQVGYVGSKGTHLYQLLDANQPTPGDPTTADSRRPFVTQFPNFEQIATIRSVGNSMYHSLQATLRTSDFHGLTSQVSFTWSHSIDTGSETLDFFGTSGFAPQDSNNLRGSRSESEFDQRRALIFSFVYRLPSRFKKAPWTKILNGWQVSNVTQLRDGFAAPVLSFDNRSGTNSFHDRPDCLGPIRYQLKDFTMPYVVSGIVTTPLPAGVFRYGTCKRNPIVAPGLAATDISIGKDFQITERLGLQLRADFFNAFNRPNFGEPSPDLNTRITGSADDAMFDSHFGPGGPRNIQLNLRLKF